MNELVFQVSDFVALFNQTIEHVYPSVTIVGELANLRVSKGKWVYFDLKDEFSSVKFFGTVYMLPGPLEDGMMLQVRGTPRLHPQYGFSVTIQTIQPVGEGSIKKAAALLRAKLEAEGLFAPERKRPLPYPPTTVGLIASSESAAYSDFIKILNARWQGLTIELADVQVQGDLAAMQIVTAIERMNEQAKPVDVLVLVRGGGSPEDLAAFSTEQVTRAVAASRIPTMVAIGHENDVSLAELAADQRGSTPSNAAELLVPDRASEEQRLTVLSRQLVGALKQTQQQNQQMLDSWVLQARTAILHAIKLKGQNLNNSLSLLQALSPQAVLDRGYAIVRTKGQTIRSAKSVQGGNHLSIQFHDGLVDAEVTDGVQ